MATEQLIYYSSATGKMDASDLRNILEASRRNNGPCGVTGMLLHHDGNFMQVLEGTAEALDTTMDRIVTDPRHHGVTVILRGPIPDRSFPDWLMGFYEPTPQDLIQHPGVVPTRNGRLDFSAIQGAPSQALLLLRLFAGLDN